MTRRLLGRRRRSFRRSRLELLEQRRLLATDVFASNDTFITLEIRRPNLPPEIVVLEMTGDTTLISDDVPDDNIGPNSLDDIGIVVDDLSLGGFTPQTGIYTANLRPSPPAAEISSGYAEERNGPLDGVLSSPLFSELDLYLEIEVNSLPFFEGGAWTGVTETPIPLEANFSSYPPAANQPYFYSDEVGIELTHQFGGPHSPPVFLVEMSHTLVTNFGDLPPTVAISSPGNGSNVEAGEQVSVLVNAIDDDGVAEVELQVDLVSIGADTTAPYQFTFTAPATPGNTLLLQANATDTNNQTSLDAITLNVVDTTPPALVVPADASVEFGNDTSPAATGQATATDTVDPAPIVTFDDIVNRKAKAIHQVKLVFGGELSN